MTPFQKAFAAARKSQGAGGQFDFGGKQFSTNYAEDNKPEMQNEVDPMSQMLQDQFKGKTLEENLAQGNGKVYGTDTDKTSQQDMTYSDAKETMSKPETKDKKLDQKKLAEGLTGIFGGAKMEAPKFNDFNIQQKDVMKARRDALMKVLGG